MREACHNIAVQCKHGQAQQWMQSFFLPCTFKTYQAYLWAGQTSLHGLKKSCSIMRQIKVAVWTSAQNLKLRYRLKSPPRRMRLLLPFQCLQYAIFHKLDFISFSLSIFQWWQLTPEARLSETQWLEDALVERRSWPMVTLGSFLLNLTVEQYSFPVPQSFHFLFLL